MAKNIKNYSLNDKISIEDLKRAKFVKVNNEMIYTKLLNEDIELHINIPENTNDYDIKVIDTTIDDLYFAFYGENWNFPSLQKTIREYNKTMDSLVKQGIFKEKVIKK